MSQNMPKDNPPSALFCSECGTKNNGAAKFCKNCGKPLTNVQRTEAAAVQPPVGSSGASAAFVAPVSAFTGPVGELIAQRLLSPPARPGLLAVLDHYEILRVLGGGGMGIVLFARDSDTGREVAIKVVKSDLVANQHVVHRFLKEAGHLKRLRHTNIVPVLEISDRAESPYFVMPYFEKGSLANRIKPGQPLDSESILDIATQVAEGLSFAHRSGIIHRDLKPANILLGANGQVHLADFGLARTMFNDTIVDVESRQLEGTAPYMSPAVAAGDAEDTRCDIYSFGALLYEMLTGQPPYQGRGTKEILDQILAGPPKPITGLNPAADHSLAAVAEGCMARELRDRYADMRDILKDLERIKENKRPIGQGKTQKSWTIPRYFWFPACFVGMALLVWVFWSKYSPHVLGRPPSNVPSGPSTVTTLPSNWISISALEPVGNSIYLAGAGNNGETFGVYSNGVFTDLSKLLPSSWSAARAIAYGDNKLLIGGVQNEPGAANGRIGVLSLASGHFQDLTLRLSDFYYGLNSLAFNGGDFLIGGAGKFTSLQLFSPETGQFIPLAQQIPFYFAVNNIVPIGDSFLIAGAGPGPGPGQPPALGLVSKGGSFTDLRGALPPGYGATSYLAYDGKQVLMSGWDATPSTRQMQVILNPPSWTSSPVTGLPASFNLHSIAGGNGVFLVGGQLNGKAWLARFVPGSLPISLMRFIPAGAQDITAIKFTGNGFIIGGIGRGARVFLATVSNSVTRSAPSDSRLNHSSGSF